ncbi:MAG: MotA/TolQ/ExbB proton channel family protein [Bdellovibrionales bacterium]|nr:MotA/TolQ/ExbB proton channel family protein [Bdellovibrionales bacterium]
MAIVSFINEGGIFMWVILALSVIASAIILDRFTALSFSYQHSDSFFNSVLHYIRLGNYHAALGLCYRTTHPLAQVIAELVKHHSRPKETLDSAATILLQKVMPLLRRRTGYLQMLGNVSTLVGLLGTIQGLIVSFTSLSTSNSGSKAQILAEGISTAMNTTALGLIVAIPCIIFYTYLTNRENELLGKYEETVNEVIHILAYDRPTAAQPPAPAAAPEGEAGGDYFA